MSMAYPMSIVASIIDDSSCPQCGGSAPQEQGLRRWCEACNWNVAAPQSDGDEDFIARKYRQLGEQRGRKMLAELMATPSGELKPGRTTSTLVAFVIAGLIHLLSLAVGLAGLMIGFAGFPNVGSLIAAAFCVALAWPLLPRPLSVPKKVMAPDALPAFSALVGEITAKLGGVPVRHIVIDEDFNASYAVAGWRRQPVLHFGLPLWIALEPQQRVAVIAHEIAHGVNGDSARGFVVGTALGALDEWVRLLRPSHDAMTGMEALASYVTGVLSLPLVALRDLLFHLLWQESQRAEYFADYLAASMAGTSAKVGALRRLALAGHLNDTLLRNAYSSAQSGRYMLGLFRKRIETLPPREWERMRREIEAEGARLDATHPPTAFRIAFLEAHAVTEPRLAASPEMMAAIDAEFRPLEERLGQKLIARFARD
jgi:hypothetical protein